MTAKLQPNVKLQRRFLRHVKIEINGCWSWTGTKSKKGYGVIHMQVFGVNVRRRAHRIAYEIYNGSCPTNLEVRHTCDNPACVNPKHLILGTHKENMQDMVSRNRAARQRGENNPASKLTRNDVENIRTLYGQGVRQTHIAKLYNIRQTMVSNIILKKNWK